MKSAYSYRKLNHLIESVQTEDTYNKYSLLIW